MEGGEFRDNVVGVNGCGVGCKEDEEANKEEGGGDWGLRNRHGWRQSGGGGAI